MQSMRSICCISHWRSFAAAVTHCSYSCLLKPSTCPQLPKTPHTSLPRSSIVHNLLSYHTCLDLRLRTTSSPASIHDSPTVLLRLHDYQTTHTLFDFLDFPTTLNLPTARFPRFSPSRLFLSHTDPHTSPWPTWLSPLFRTPSRTVGA